MIYGTQLAAKVWSDRLPMIGISKGWTTSRSLRRVLIILFSLKKLLLQASGERPAPMPSSPAVHGTEA